MLDASLRPRSFEGLSLADAQILTSRVEADPPVQLANLFRRLCLTLRCQVEVDWFQISNYTFPARLCDVLKCLLGESACRWLGTGSHTRNSVLCGIMLFSQFRHIS